MRETVAEALAGWSIKSVDEGEAVIELLWNGSADLIVLDLDLPRLTAYDVIRHLSMRRPELLPHTVVVLSERQDFAQLLDAVEIGHRIRRPLEASALREIAAPARTA